MFLQFNKWASDCSGKPTAKRGLATKSAVSKNNVGKRKGFFDMPS